MGNSELIRVSIEGLDQLAKMRAILDPKLYEKASRSALVAAAKSATKQAGKSISQRYNLKSARIKQDVDLVSVRGDVATLLFASKPPTISQFGYKPGTRASGQIGLGYGKGFSKPSTPGTAGSAMIFKGQRVKYPTTFMGMSSGGVMLPFRVGKGYTRTGKRKLLVGYGPSIARIWDSGKFGSAIRSEVEAEIMRSYIASFQRVLDSAARGYGGKR